MKNWGKTIFFKPTIGNDSLHQDSNNNVFFSNSRHSHIKFCQEYDVPAPKYS